MQQYCQFANQVPDVNLLVPLFSYIPLQSICRSKVYMNFQEFLLYRCVPTIYLNATKQQSSSEPEKALNSL